MTTQPHVFSCIIIGAGAAGLNTAKNLLENQIQVIIYEKTDQLGGTWVYRDSNDPYFLESSMYKNLRTNLPKQIMKFPDFDFPIDIPNFPHHPQVKQYLNDYAEKFNLKKLIHYHCTVKNIEYKQDKWFVTVSDEKSKKVFTNQYDAVAVCNGHYTIPFIPKLEGMDQFPGKWSHSHTYRESFSGKTVLIIGAGPSGQEIAAELASAGCKVYHTSIEFKTSQESFVNNKRVMAMVKQVCKDGTAIFIDGEVSEKIDEIIFCTGYEYSFPFISEDIVRVEDGKVTPVYKHVFHCKIPSLVFIGLPFKVVPFPLFEYQTRWVAAVFSGKAKLPTNLVQEHKEGVPNRKYHQLGENQWEYCDWIAKQIGYKCVDQMVQDIYSEISRKRKKDIQKFRNAEYESIQKYERLKCTLA